MRASLTAALTLVLLGVSCTGPRTEHESSSSPSTGTISPSAAPTPSAQPVTDYFSFTQALDAAGFTVREGKRMRGYPFAVPDHTVFVDDVRVSTYAYPSEKALADVRASISPDGYSVPTEIGGIAIVEWVAPPHFYGAGRLLVVYVGDERRTLKALDFLLGPQFAGG